MRMLQARPWVRFMFAIIAALLMAELYDVVLSYVFALSWTVSWMQKSAFEIPFVDAQGNTGTIYLFSLYSMVVRIPLILLCFGVYAFFMRRTGNHADGHLRCRKCDYDLTGNTSGVCPECGEMVK